MPLPPKSTKQRRELDAILTEWYGVSEAPGAMLRHLNPPLPVDDIMKKLTRKLAPPWQRTMSMLESRWEEIVGSTASKHCRPACFDGTVLRIELAHPAFRMALDTPSMKETLMRRINALSGEDSCTEIRFIAAGGNNSFRKK